MSDECDRETTPGSVRADDLTYIDFVAKYWGDPEFKARVDADPAAALRAEGFEVPEGAEVELLESTGNKLHIVLPRASKR